MKARGASRGQLALHVKNKIVLRLRELANRRGEMLCSHLQTRRREKRGTMRGGGFRRFWVLWMQFGVWPPLRNGPIAKGNGEVATNEAKIRVVGRLPTRLRNFADRTGELNLKILIASTNTRKNGPIVHKSSPNLSSATQSLHPTQVKAKGPLAPARFID